MDGDRARSRRPTRSSPIAATSPATRRGSHGTAATLRRPSTVPTLDAFVGERRGGGGAASSVARQLAAIRMLHRFLAEEGVRADDPTADIEGVRVPAGIPKPLTRGRGRRAARRAPSANDPVALRDRALLELLYATGARISEACGLSLGDFDSRRAARAAVRQGLQGAHRAVRAVRRRRRSPTGSARRVGRTSSRRGGHDAATPRRCS